MVDKCSVKSQESPMDQPTTNVSPAAMVEAIESNTAEFLITLGRAGGAEERKDPNIHWIIGGSPIDYHNCVVHADLTPASADEAIAASIARFQALHVPGS